MANAEEAAGSGKRKGIFDSLSTLAITLVTIGRDRLELLSIELEEEVVWRSSMLVWTLIALFCAGMGVVLITLIGVLLLWDTSRLLALGIPALLFLLGAVMCWQIVLAKAKVKPGLFSASLGELLNDREKLTTRP